jgi:hypothetical protein
MKKKKLFIRVFGIFFLIFFIIAYSLFYFVPTVEKINHHRRNLKDMKLNIEHFLNQETGISFPDERERAIFKEADEALRRKISEVKSREDFIGLFTRVVDYLKKRGRMDGIFNLGITFDSKALELNAATQLTNKKHLEQLLDFSFAGLASPSPSAPLEGLNHQAVFLRFSGNLRNALNFINHIPWGDDYIRLDNIRVSPGNVSPYFVVSLNVYFIDFRSKDAGPSSQSVENKEIELKHAGKGEEGLVIDFDSPLLLKRVYEDPIGKYPMKELPNKHSNKPLKIYTL